MNRKLRLPLALALALGSGSAFALGLGQVQVKSSLYEPLEAEIPVLSNTPGEADALTVRLASPEAFARVGLDRPQMMAANLEFAVVENARGQKVIRITTASKVNDPFLSFLVEADWGKGKLLREFTVLLDPPGTAPVTRATATAPVREAQPQPQPPRPQPAVPPAAEPAPAPVATAPTAAETAPARQQPSPTPAPSPAAPSTGDYAVAGGDTLWSIAQRTRPDASVSVNQMMVALLQANPDAFIGENINRIKSGAILRIPDRAQIEQLSAVQANTMVREQMDAWRGAREPQLQPAEPDADAVATAPAPVRTPESRLELVPPRGEQPAEGARSGLDTQSQAGSELRADLARAQEEIGTRDQEIRELRSRVEELEGIRDDSQRLIALKDSELATLQRRLAELEAARQADADSAAAEAAAPVTTTPAAPTVDADGDGIADAPVEPAPSELEAEVAEVDDALVPGIAEDEAAAQVGEGTTAADARAAREAERAAQEPAAAVPAAAEPMPARDVPWYRNLWLLGGIALVVAGLLAFLLARRKPRTESVTTGRGYDSGALAASVPTATGAAVATAGIDEAQESEREAALLDALAERPEDLGRHLELARYYYEQGDADAFEGAAEAMYAQIYDPDNLMWMQVVAMGRELLPDHPLFAAPPADEAVEPVDELPPAAPRQDWDTATFSTAELESSAGTPAAADEWTDETATGGFESGSEEAGDLVFDEGHRATEPPEEAPPAFETPDFETPASEVPPYRAPEPEVPFEYGGDDASSTKLELARAYLDMGDVEGARGMLEEVMGEGNAGQRAEARRLLDEIR